MEGRQISWKKIEGNFWKPIKEGEQIEGILLDKEDKGKDIGMMYTIETSLTPNKNLKQLSFYGSYILDERLRQVKVGDLIRITFDGKIKHPKDNKKSISQFTVEVAEFN